MSGISRRYMAIAFVLFASIASLNAQVTPNAYLALSNPGTTTNSSNPSSTLGISQSGLTTSSTSTSSQSSSTVTRPPVSNIQEPPMEQEIPAELSAIERMINASIPQLAPPLRQYGYEFFARETPNKLALVGDDYVVGPGDTMVAYLWGDAVDIKELPSAVELIVDRDGTVNFPSIGRVSVWGQSLAQIKAFIKSSLDKKYKRIDLSLTLGKLREFPITVAGFVTKPGIILATAVDTLFDIIARAGGALPHGSLRSIVLTRKNSPPLNIDVYDALIKGQASDLRLKEGDTVLINNIGQVAAVAGSVKRPAIYELKANSTIGDLLALAGGALPSAVISKASLIRFKNDTRQIIDGSLSDYRFLGTPLSDGDALILSSASAILENAVYLEGRIKYPGRYDIKDFSDLRSLILYGELFNDTDLDFATVHRIEAGGRSLNFTFRPKDVLSSSVASIQLSAKDIVTLYPADELPEYFDYANFPETITLSGEIRYPGLSARVAGLALSDILTPDQLLPSTNLDYAVIDRRTAGGKRPNQTFAPRDVLAGVFDLPLESLDFIRFFKAGEVPQELSFTEYPETVVLRGAARYPNAYRYKEGLALSDLLNEDQVTTETSLYYGRIIRSEAGGVQRVLPFIPAEILSGVYDIPLKMKDDITLFTLEETSRSQTLSQSSDLDNTTSTDESTLIGSMNGNQALPSGMSPSPSTQALTPSNDSYAMLDFDTSMGVGEFLLIGEARYSGLYGHRDGLMLSNILITDQILPSTNIFYAQISGLDNNGRPVYRTFSPKKILEGTEDLEIKAMDIIRLFKFGDETKSYDPDKYPEAVLLEGPVLYAGVYSWSIGMTLSDIVSVANFKLETDRDYATILRTDDDGTNTLIHFVPNDIIYKKADIKLQPRDLVSFRVKNVYEPIKISGEVLQPQVISFYPGITLEELLKTVELNTDIRELKVIVERMNQERVSIYLEDVYIKQRKAPPIEPGDSLVVKKLKANEAEKIILVRGEVSQPQALAFSEGMRLSDALLAAGDLMPSAYLKGLVLQRPSVAEAQKAQIDRLSNAIAAARQSAQSDFTTAANAASMDDGAALTAINSAAQLAAQEAELARISEVYSASLGRIALDMPETINELKGSSADILLERDDTIFVPRLPNFVTILGEAMNQISIAYYTGITARQALEDSGWVSEDANMGSAYIVRANGRVKSGEGWRFWFFQPSILNITLEPGDTIYIPRKPYRLNTVLPIVSDVMQIIGQLISSAVSTVALTRTF